MTPQQWLRRGWARFLCMETAEPIAAPQSFMAGTELADWFVDRLTVECAMSLLPQVERDVLSTYCAIRCGYSTDWQALRAIALAAHMSIERVRKAFDAALDDVAAQCAGRDPVRGFDDYLALHG